MSAKHPVRKLLPVFVGLFILSLFVGGTWLLMKWVQDSPADSKKVVQQITLIAPPPPPPPPPKEEPPPPPEQEEVELEEEIEDVPEDIPEMADMEPASADLGIDAEGGAGADGFGLVGRKGGRGLLAGGAFSWYKSIVQQDIFDALADSKDIRKKAYKIAIKIWIDKNGEVEKYEISHSTGDKQLDEEIKRQLSRIAEFSEAPPIEMPQPIRIAINSRM